MRMLRVMTVWTAVMGLGSSAMAGDLLASVAKAVEKQEQATQTASLGRQPMPKAYLWSGAALFAGGMVVAMNGFLNNRNGEFPEFGEADSTNVAMGAAGLATAVGGGMLLLLGRKHAGAASSITVGFGRVTAQARVAW